MHPRTPPSSFPRHHSENASLYKITLIVSACMSKESHFSFDNLGKEFASSLVDDWNSLPSKVVEARDVEQFKAELDEAWKDIRFLHTAL